MIPVPFSEKREQNEARYPCQEGEERCLFCGKPVKPESRVWVAMSTNCDLLLPEEEAAAWRSNIHQGGFVVGPECKRKVPKAYLQPHGCSAPPEDLELYPPDPWSNALEGVPSVPSDSLPFSHICQGQALTKEDLHESLIYTVEGLPDRYVFVANASYDSLLRLGFVPSLGTWTRRDGWIAGAPQSPYKQWLPVEILRKSNLWGIYRPVTPEDHEQSYPFPNRHLSRLDQVILPPVGSESFFQGLLPSVVTRAPYETPVKIEDVLPPYPQFLDPLIKAQEGVKPLLPFSELTERVKGVLKPSGFGLDDLTPYPRPKRRIGEWGALGDGEAVATFVTPFKWTLEIQAWGDQFILAAVHPMLLGPVILRGEDLNPLFATVEQAKQVAEQFVKLVGRAMDESERRWQETVIKPIAEMTERLASERAAREQARLLELLLAEARAVQEVARVIDKDFQVGSRAGVWWARVLGRASVEKDRFAQQGLVLLALQQWDPEVYGPDAGYTVEQVLAALEGWHG